MELEYFDWSAPFPDELTSAMLAGDLHQDLELTSSDDSFPALPAYDDLSSSMDCKGYKYPPVVNRDKTITAIIRSLSMEALRNIHQGSGSNSCLPEIPSFASMNAQQCVPKMEPSEFNETAQCYQQVRTFREMMSAPSSSVDLSLGPTINLPTLDFMSEIKEELGSESTPFTSELDLSQDQQFDFCDDFLSPLPNSDVAELLRQFQRMTSYPSAVTSATQSRRDSNSPCVSLPPSRRTSATPIDAATIHQFRKNRRAGPVPASPSPLTKNGRQRQRGNSLPYSMDVTRQHASMAMAASRRSYDASSDSQACLLSLLQDDSPPSDDVTPHETSMSPTSDVYVPEDKMIVVCDECANRSICKHNPDVLKWHRALRDFVVGQPCGVCGGDMLRELTTKYGRDSNAFLQTKQPFVCKLCNAEFTRSDRLLAHSHMHTGKKPFPCLTCPATFSRKARLATHIADDHPKAPRHVQASEEMIPLNASFFATLPGFAI